MIFIRGHQFFSVICYKNKTASQRARSHCLQFILFLISLLFINASVSSTAHHIPFVPGCLAAGVAEATVEVGLHFLINGLLLPPPPLRAASLQQLPSSAVT